MYVESKGGMGDDFVAQRPGIRVTYAADGSVAFVDQVRGLPGVTAQQLQTMGGRVMLVGGLLAFVALGGPAALLARFAIGWAWTKSLLVGAGIGAAGAAAWGWRTETAIKQLAAAPGSSTAPATASATGPSILSTPIQATPPTTLPPGFTLATMAQQGQQGQSTSTVVYRGVTITLTAPPSTGPTPVSGTSMLIMPVWTAAFTLPGTTTSQSVTGSTPALTLASAQAAIDAALAPPSVVPAINPASVVSQVTPPMVAWQIPVTPPKYTMTYTPPPPPSSQPQLMSPITYRGVAVAFLYTGGAVTPSMKLPGNFVATSLPAQPTYAAAVAAAKAAIDAAYAQASLPSPL